jgi:hypothetical protein
MSFSPKRTTSNLRLYRTVNNCKMLDLTETLLSWGVDLCSLGSTDVLSLHSSSGRVVETLMKRIGENKVTYGVAVLP